MKTTAFAIAILMSGAAFAQTSTDTDADMNADVNVQTDTMTDMDHSDMSTHTDMSTGTDVATDTDVTTGTDWSTGTDTTMTTSTDTTAYTAAPTDTTMAAATMTPASGAIVQPSNADPEHDARGIAVLSDPAAVPAGWNGVATTAVGGPLVDPATGATMDTADATYPACSASVTDNCLQAYERGLD